MKAYEGMFVFPPEAAVDARKTQLQNLEELIRRFKGSIVQKIEWGKRPLGYPRKKFREGYFVILDFQAPPAELPEFRKALELHEDLIHFMVTVKDVKRESKPASKPGAQTAKPTPAPSAAGTHAAPHR